MQEKKYPVIELYNDDLVTSRGTVTHVFLCPILVLHAFSQLSLSSNKKAHLLKTWAPAVAVYFQQVCH